MSDSSNVILFPKLKAESPPQTLDDIQENITKMRVARADYVMSVAVPHMMQVLIEGGVDLDNEKCSKDLALFCESFKALIYKAFDLDHPLHNFTESSFTLHEYDDGTIEYKYDLDILVNHGEE